AVVIERIRSIARGAPAAVPRTYRSAGTMDAGSRVDRFCERVGDYRADVHRISAAEIAGAVARACAAKGAARVVAPAGLPAAWRPRELEVVDGLLTARELDALDGVVTGCTVAVAETGTIALTAGPQEGRRALTLAPDLHVCAVE